jgi:UDP-N-acetylglucosamine 4-epimerase
MNVLMQHKKVLVTGGAGFIGSNLIDHLVTDNEVICLDDLSTGYLRNIEAYTGNPNFRFIRGSICDPAMCAKAAEGVDYVFHQAALGSVPRSVKDPVATNAANIDGFLNMLVASRDAGVRRFIYAASSSTYGDSTELPKIENHIGKPLSPYAITKLVNELYAGIFTRLYGLETIGLRYFNVFGKRQDPGGAYAAVIPLWVKTLLDHNRPVINGDGTFSRDFTHVENVVQANLLAAMVPWDTLMERMEHYRTVTGEADYEPVFNIAFGGNTTLTELFESLRDNLALFDPAIAGITPEYGPERLGDIPHSMASIKKATMVLGYEPAIDARIGFSHAAEWYYENLHV